MGSVFKKSYTKPMPPRAEIIVRKGQRLARWRDSQGKVQTAPLTTGKDGSERLSLESRTYFARYRDGDGIVVECSTECRDEGAARSVLTALERGAERVRSGIVTSQELAVADRMSDPIADHAADYVEAMSAVEMHRQNTRRYLDRLILDCGWTRLADMKRSDLERWIATQSRSGRSARNIIHHRAAAVAFAHWCVSDRRLAGNPFAGVAKPNADADPRRKRRAMTEGELVNLLDVARRRPLLDALTVRRGARRGQAVAHVRDEVRDQLDLLGRERALIYKTLVLTGLRKNELASLTVAQLQLDGPVPHVELDAADEKNGEGSAVMIRADLADDLRRWLDERLAALQADAHRRGEPIPARLPADAKLFDVPAGLVRIFDRDLKAAGIAKRDERGRTLDVHALRTTFATLLSKGGVPLRTAQAAMRHSDPRLTANVYTDPKLLDVAGSLDALPSLPLGRGPDADTERVRATGTVGPQCHAVDPQLALQLSLNPCKPGQSGASGGKMNSQNLRPPGTDGLSVTEASDRTKAILTTPVASCHDYTRQDLNLQPLVPKTMSDTSQSLCSSGLASPQTVACTPASGKEQAFVSGRHLEDLAAAIRKLSPTDRDRLFVLLDATEGGAS